jgi:hypothetical protein
MPPPPQKDKGMRQNGNDVQNTFVDLDMFLLFGIYY